MLKSKPKTSAKKHLAAKILCLGIGASFLAVPQAHATLAHSGVQQAPVVHFTVKEYKLSSAAGLPAGQIQDIKGIWQKYTGEVTLATVKAAQNAAQTYLNNNNPVGAYAVELPPQRVVGGVIHMVIVAVPERKLERIIVAPTKGYSRENIMNSLPALQIGKPVNLSDLTRNIQQANNNPLKTTEVALVQVGNNALQADVLAKAPYGAIRGFASVNNYGTTETGPAQFNIGVVDANLTGHDDVLTLNGMFGQAITKQEAAAVQYVYPFYKVHQTLTLSASYSRSNPGHVSIFNINGSGITAGIQWGYQLPPISQNAKFSVNLGYSYHYYRNQVTYGNSTQSYLPSAATAPISAGLTGVINPRAGTAISLGLSVSHNFAGELGSSTAKELSGLQPGAGKYTLMRYNVNLSQDLPAGFNISEAVSGQESWNPLVPGEQLQISGPYAVRGFRDYTGLGDSGVISGTTVSTPNLLPAKFNPRGLMSTNAYVFYDWGSFWNVHPNLEGKGQTISSTGLGVNFTIASVSLNLYGAYKLQGYKLDDYSGTNTLISRAGFWGSLTFDFL